MCCLPTGGDRARPAQGRHASSIARASAAAVARHPGFAPQSWRLMPRWRPFVARGFRSGVRRLCSLPSHPNELPACVCQRLPDRAYRVRLGRRVGGGRDHVDAGVRLHRPDLRVGLHGLADAGVDEFGHPCAARAPDRRSAGPHHLVHPPAPPDRSAAGCTGQLRGDGRGGACATARAGHRMRAGQPADSRQGAPHRPVRRSPAVALEPVRALCHHPQPDPGDDHAGAGHQQRHRVVRA